MRLFRRLTAESTTKPDQYEQYDQYDGYEQYDEYEQYDQYDQTRPIGCAYG